MWIWLLKQSTPGPEVPLAMFSSSMKLSAIFKRENKPAEAGQYLLDGKERCSESRFLPKILAIIAPKAVPSIIDCTMVFSRHLCAFGFISFCVAMDVPHIIRTMFYSERNIFARKERRVQFIFAKFHKQNHVHARFKFC